MTAGSSRVILVLVAMAVIFPAPPARAATEIPVMTTPAGEFQPARTANALAWEQNTRARPNEYVVLVRPDGAPTVQANRPGTTAAMGDFAGQQLIYQQYRGNPRKRGRSDLFFFDTSSGARSKVPGVNSRQWEYWPSSSGPWLLFARWKPRNEVRRLFLHNMETGERRLLDKIKGRKAFLGPGQLNGNFAVWSTCRPRCNVFRYDIAARSEDMVHNPGFYQRAPAVTPGGTVYFSRGGKGCGASVALVRVKSDGSQEVMVQLQQGLDIRDTYAYTEPNGTIEVYYERNACRTKAGSDIYKVRDLALATLTVTTDISGPASGTVTSTPAGIQCGADCSEDFEKGTSVTLNAIRGPNTVFAGWTGACTGTGPCIVTMDEAMSVTATFLPLGSITISKDAMPNDGHNFTFDPSPNLFGTNFLLDDDPNSSTPNEVLFQGLGSGTYTVDEVSLPLDWQLAQISCLSSSATTTRSGNRITINLGSGGAASCTFVNDLREAKIVVSKQTSPPSTLGFTFVPSWGASFTLTHGQSHDTGFTLDPRTTYSVQEVIPPGWDLLGATCSGGNSPDNISPDPAEIVTCAFSNRQDGRIVITKQTNPDGSSQSFAFSRSYGSDFSLSDGQSHDSGFLDPGTYSVSENTPTGWDLTSATCDDGSTPANVSLQAGETVTCSFTNTQESTIIVAKETNPDGATGSFTFTGDAAGTISDGGQIVVSGLSPGTYSSTEDDPGFPWSLANISCDDANSSGSLPSRTATFQLEPGESVTCTFTNNFLSP